MTKIKTILLTLVAFMAISMNATERFVFFKPTAGGMSLAGATIGYSDQESKAVQIAAANLQQDFQRVMGFTPVLSPLTSHPSPLILIGTVGCNSRIDQLVKQKVLKDLKGKREKYIITTIDGQLVIAGSDRRGTVYGIYELSQQMGVSPWYWWMDVPVKHRDLVVVSPGTYTDGEPAVEFRGLFLKESCSEGPHKGLYHLVARRVALPVNQLDQQFALRVGQFLHPRFISAEYLTLHFLHVGLLCLLGG